MSDKDNIKLWKETSRYTHSSLIHGHFLPQISAHPAGFDDAILSATCSARAGEVFNLGIIKDGSVSAAVATNAATALREAKVFAPFFDTTILYTPATREPTSGTLLVVRRGMGSTCWLNSYHSFWIGEDDDLDGGVRVRQHLAAKGLLFSGVEYGGGLEAKYTYMDGSTAAYHHSDRYRYFTFLLALIHDERVPLRHHAESEEVWAYDWGDEHMRGEWTLDSADAASDYAKLISTETPSETAKFLTRTPEYFRANSKAHIHYVEPSGAGA